jgi:Na+/H+-dicarboxylate symporter
VTREVVGVFVRFSCAASNDFYKYCRRKMLALIIFSFLIGFACLRSGERALL